MSSLFHLHAKRITITTIACDTCRMPNNASQTIQYNMPQLNAHIYLPLLICYDLIARTKIKLFSENIINILFIIPLYIQFSRTYINSIQITYVCTYKMINIYLLYICHSTISLYIIHYSVLLLHRRPDIFIHFFFKFNLMGKRHREDHVFNTYFPL